MSSDCGFSQEHKLIYFQLSSTVSILYFAVYIIITIIVSLYALIHKSAFYSTMKQWQNNKKISRYDKCRPYFKCYLFLLLHFAIQSINIGVVIQWYYISTTDCDLHIPNASLNMNILPFATLGISILYRIISTFKIYSITHNLQHCLYQFLFDFGIIKSLFVELTKYKYIAHRKHHLQLCYCFQWFLRIQCLFHAAPMAFIQLISVLFCIHFESDSNEYFIPILISLILCTINVIIVSFESDSVVFNPHSFNVFKIWFLRLIFRIFDVTLRLISIALCWLCIGGYFVIFLTFFDLLYILISCIRLQLLHKGLLRKHSQTPSILSPSSLHKRGNTVRISHEYCESAYIYRPNSIGRMIVPENDNHIIMALEMESTPDINALTPLSRTAEHDTSHQSIDNNKNNLVCDILLRIMDYYIHGMIVILISFRLEDRSRLFSIWFWRLRVIINILLMCLITISGYLRIYCKTICFHEYPYDIDESFININGDDYYIGFILFIYAWFCSVILPILFLYLANGKIKTDKYSPQTIDDIMINGDIVGIFEIELFGAFGSRNSSHNHQLRTVYTLTACNLNWDQLSSDVLMQYLYILLFAQVNLNEIYDPYDCNSNLMNQLCRNEHDCYQCFNEITQITDLLTDDDNNNNITAIACCCSCGNFRIFKQIIEHFGYQYLVENAFFALHYAFRCRGNPLQQKQANRIIDYVFKNTKINIDDLIDSYDEEQRIAMTRIIRKKLKNIHKNKTNKSSIDDRTELLQSQLSNNTVVTINMDDDDDDDDKDDDETHNHVTNN